jgi:hypothetical protein
VSNATSPDRRRLPPDHVRIHPIGSALAGVLGAAAGTRAGAAFGTIDLALSAVPVLARRIRQLPHAATATTYPQDHRG